MEKRFFFHLILIFLFFMLEITLLPLLTPPFIAIRLILLSGLSLLFLGYREESFWWFIIGGLMFDFFSPLIFGLYTIIFVGIYLIVNFLKQRFVHQPNLFFLTGVLVVVSLILSGFDWLSLSHRPSWDTFLQVAGWNMLANFFVIWPVYLLFIYLSNWLEIWGLFAKNDSLT